MIETKTKTRYYLNYMSFLKFLSMIIIIMFHYFRWRNKPISYGQRMCEFLFISSGFLVGYNHYKKQMPNTLEQSFIYTYKRFKNFYPLEIINLIFFIIFEKKINKINLTDIEVIVSNILMIKSWSPYKYVHYSFNGVSWFLSSLLFCYFMTPFLLLGIKNIKNAILLFIIFAFTRMLSEGFIILGGENIFILDFHVNPIIRCIEFYLGMLTIPLFFKIKSYLDKNKNNFFFKILFTLIQIILPILMHFLIIKYNNIKTRVYFVFAFTLFTFVIGLDYGYLSELFSIKIIKKIFSYQMEIYLFQSSATITIKKIMKFYNLKFPSNVNLDFFIKIINIFMFAFLYKELIKEKLTKIMDKIINLIKKLFTSNEIDYIEINL